MESSGGASGGHPADEGARAAREAADEALTALLEARPEDATALGVPGYERELSDPSPAALRASAKRLAAARARVEAARGTADAAGQLDLACAARALEARLQRLATDAHASALEPLLLPTAAAHHARLHGHDDSARARLRRIPAVLEAHAANLRQGARRGLAPARRVAREFAERLLPRAADGLRELARLDPQAAAGARSAYAHLARVVADELVPVAPPVRRLGLDETERRLAQELGVPRASAELRRAADAALARAHEALAEALGVTPSDDDALAAGVAALLAPRAPSADAARTSYEAHASRAATVARARGVVTVPDALAVAFSPLPGGLADGTALTNWPAPLLDPTAPGHALYADDPAAHPAISLKNLAVHEVVPGHYLQSATWQKLASGGRIHPVRFVGVLDDVAFALGEMGALLAVEGWAVHVERTLFAEGFYDAPGERAFFAFCDALRAARVRLDLDLHATDAPLHALAADVASATFLPLAWAEAQVLRAQRLPLQGLTYQVGADETDACVARLAAALGDARAARDALLAEGPVSPSWLGRVP